MDERFACSPVNHGIYLYELKSYGIVQGYLLDDMAISDDGERRGLWHYRLPSHSWPRYPTGRPGKEEDTIWTCRRVLLPPPLRIVDHICACSVTPKCNRAWQTSSWEGYISCPGSTVSLPRRVGQGAGAHEGVNGESRTTSSSRVGSFPNLSVTSPMYISFSFFPFYFSLIIDLSTLVLAITATSGKRAPRQATSLNRKWKSRSLVLLLRTDLTSSTFPFFPTALFGHGMSP